jgi:hypothetical protein
MPSEVPSRRNPIACVAAVWACFFLLYILFAGKFSAAELAAGAVAAGLAAIYQAVLRAKAGASRLDPAALRPLLGAVGAVPGETLRVAAALARAIAGSATAGRVRVVAAPAGADPASAAWRAIAIAAASLAPNSFVVATVFDRGEIVAHRLADDPADEAA